MLSIGQTYKESFIQLNHEGPQRFSYTSQVRAIQEMIPTYSEQQIENLMVDRRGNLCDSHMITFGLHRGAGKGKTFQVTPEGLKESEKASKVRRLEQERLLSKSLPSQYATVQAIWDKEAAISGGLDNILGENGRLILEDARLQIPVVEANEQDLSYYGATLVHGGEVVEFEDQDYPIWAMSIGENYVPGFIMKENGFYLEYHNDKPHFHMPLSPDAGGCYLLAKDVGSSNSETGSHLYHITGFTIPYGKAVYTYKGSIHCDAALTGKQWLVGYTEAEDFSTVLLRTPEGEKVHVDFRG